MKDKGMSLSCTDDEFASWLPVNAEQTSEVVHTVCSQDEHCLSGKVLKVSPYHSCLVLPASSETPQFIFPDPIVLDSLSLPKLKFLKQNETQKKQFSQRLANHYAVVSWDGPFPKIECGITNSVRDYRKIVKSWVENVKKAVNDFDASCEITEFRTPEERTDVKQELKKLQIANPESVSVEINSKNGVINIITLKDCADDVIEQIEEAIDKAKVKCKKKKELRFLKAVGFAEKMKQRYESNVDIEIDTESSQVIVSGPQNSVSEILLEVYEVVDKLYERRVRMDSSQIELLSRKVTADKIKRRMRDKGLGDIWAIEDSAVFLYAEDNADLIRMENVIESMLTQITVYVEKNAKRLIGSKEWNELESTLHKEYSGCVIIEKTDNRLIVYTIVEHKDNVDTKVKRFFSKNATYKVSYAGSDPSQISV